MLNKILESLYLKVFINVIVGQEQTTVHTEIRSKSGDISSNENVFDSTKLTEEIYSYIMDLTKESPYYYISFLDISKEQGALPTCDKNKLAEYEELSTAEYKCIDKRWSIFTPKTELSNLKKKYEDVGIDFIFSPFAVLANFFKDKIDKNLAIYALLEEGTISVAVFKDSELLFAQYRDLEIDLEANRFDLEDLDEDKEIDLGLDEEDDDGVILDDLAVDDDLEDFSDIADLDNLEDIDEFSEGKDFEEELEENQRETVFEETLSDEGDTHHFNEDYQIFLLIQSAINQFYNDEKYTSEFLENIYIADTTQSGGDLKRYLEEEMFLNVYIRSINLGTEICNLAKKELGI